MRDALGGAPLADERASSWSPAPGWWNGFGASSVPRRAIIVHHQKNNRLAEQLQERNHVGLILRSEVEPKSPESEVEGVMLRDII